MKTPPNRYSSTLSHPPCEPGPVTKPSPPSPNGSHEPLVIVDAANVVGSVPDGWWRDRRRAIPPYGQYAGNRPARCAGSARSAPSWGTPTWRPAVTNAEDVHLRPVTTYPSHPR